MSPSPMQPTFTWTSSVRPVLPAVSAAQPSAPPRQHTSARAAASRRCRRDRGGRSLTLQSIKRTAKAGTAIGMDPISFTYRMRPNRVDGTDDIPPLTRPRVSTVTSETGAITTVTLSAAECVRSQVVGAAEDTNTRNCFPQYWNVNGSTTASVDWVHKYRVLAVSTSDPAGQNDGLEQQYVYSGAAWRRQKFRYLLSNTKASWVSTATLKADGETYNTTYAIHDALLRKLQDQAPTPQGGRLLTDTRYDSRGLAYGTCSDIFDSTTEPNGTYTRAEYGEAPTQTETVYDGAERATTSTLHVYGVKKWSTGTTYTGDSTATTAVQGGTAERTITDARGRTTESREYAGVNPADPAYGGGLGTPYTATKFTYSLDDKKESVTGPDGARWNSAYDLNGRMVSADDPDKGASTLAYDGLDRVIKATDTRGHSILTEYDALGRSLGTWSGEKTDAEQLTSYTYDTVLKGQPASSTRYVGGKTGLAYTKSVTAYDSLNRATGTRLRLPAADPLVKDHRDHRHRNRPEHLRLLRQRVGRKMAHGLRRVVCHRHSRP
ncbi:hypothetical protein FEF34_33160 [Streptomyces marianii]|uniref:RHS repeat protein n=1 Tax=Streptomyces marianii TaxID=1817406 RepID=A0A5R9EAK1_9ACTN|nr:hypothetical protein FEF34_33160 [Streptomyces marianii]